MGRTVQMRYCARRPDREKRRCPVRLPTIKVDVNDKMAESALR